MSLACVVLVAALAVVDSLPADRARLDSLADATHRSIARFSDRRVAVSEGYRRIGADFPGMGEHWVHIGVLLSAQLDPARPTVLTYATIAGQPTLLGAGFVLTTRGTEPLAAPGWPRHWHEHSGALAEESGVHSGARITTPGATRVWVLHIWTALPNPSGRYDSDNWALPFARAGLAAPADVDHDRGRALSLAVGDGDRFLRDLLVIAAGSGSADHGAIDAAIHDAQQQVRELLAQARARGGFEPELSSGLALSWRLLRTRLVGILGPDVAPLLEPPHSHSVAPTLHGGGDHLVP